MAFTPFGLFSSRISYRDSKAHVIYSHSFAHICSFICLCIITYLAILFICLFVCLCTCVFTCCKLCIPQLRTREEELVGFFLTGLYRSLISICLISAQSTLHPLNQLIFDCYYFQTSYPSGGIFLDFDRFVTTNKAFLMNQELISTRALILSDRYITHMDPKAC